MQYTSERRTRNINLHGMLRVSNEVADVRHRIGVFPAAILCIDSVILGAVVGV